MGLYRATMNTPILKFGKSALLSDTDPLVEAWLASGAFVRLDDVATVPLERDEPLVVEDDESDELVDEGVGTVDAEPVVEVEPEVEAKPEPRKPGRPKGSTNRPKPVDNSSGLNPTFGIEFDDDDDDN